MASLHLMEEIKKTIEYKFLVFKYFETVRKKKRKMKNLGYCLLFKLFDKLEIKKKEKERQKSIKKKYPNMKE